MMAVTARRGLVSRDLLSDLAAMMWLCLRPHRWALRQRLLVSAWRCCSRSWRSWPVSATPLMGGSWRSPPRWIVTSSAVPRGHGRSRRWWPGSWYLVGERTHDYDGGAPAGGVSALRAGHAGGSTLAGSGRGHRGARGCGIGSALRPAGGGGLCQPAAHRGQARTTTRTRSRPATAALDHQDLQRAVQLLADQTRPPGRGEVRRGAGLAS